MPRAARKPDWRVTLEALRALVNTHGFAAVLAVVGSLGWLHTELGDLGARTTTNTAENAQLRADVRELHLELANCGRHE